MINQIRLFVLCLLGTFAVSCSDGQAWLDSDSLTGTDLRLVQIDTFQVDMATFRFDSIVNDSGYRLLIGRYEDPVFGKVRADAYMELVPATYSISDNVVFDSIVLNLPYDGYFYADTLATQHLAVRRLTQTITLRNGATTYYNTAQFGASDGILGERSFRPRISNDSITIRLSGALGQELFEGIQSGTLATTEAFTDVFKGIRISPGDSDNGSIIGYNAQTSYIRLYYSQEGDDDDEQHLDFKLNNTAEVKKYANRIQSDRAGTSLSSLSGQEAELGSGQAGNQVFVQGGIGIGTKIRFPSIHTIREVNEGDGQIFKARLKLKIDPNLYSEKLYAADSLYVAIVDQNNDVLSVLTDGAGNEVKAYLEKTNPEYNEVYLVARVEEFLNKMLEFPEFRNYGLVLLPTKYNATATRLIINGPTNSQSKLELTYAIYD